MRRLIWNKGSLTHFNWSAWGNPRGSRPWPRHAESKPLTPCKSFEHIRMGSVEFISSGLVLFIRFAPWFSLVSFLHFHSQLLNSHFILSTTESVMQIYNFTSFLLLFFCFTTKSCMPRSSNLSYSVSEKIAPFLLSIYLFILVTSKVERPIILTCKFCWVDMVQVHWSHRTSCCNLQLAFVLPICHRYILLSSVSGHGSIVYFVDF